ncbi:MAG TPA: isoprenylcysteine carboxylmethyltransferase family protein [Caulobacteraceae bacterium]|jgi:protein-S-isoprenylcysteine O-methyltransferase Ste14
MVTALRKTIRVGETAGAAWFVVLALTYSLPLPALLRAAFTGGFAEWASLVSRACSVSFMAIMAWLMMARPAAVARRDGLGPWLAAMAGTYGVWLIGFLPKAHLWPLASLAASVITLIGSGLIILSVLSLGRSFSIVPQARNLVTAGPYAFVRHPLYAAEELALIGVAMHIVWYISVPVVALHVALQIRRMGYEEELLGKVFPGYETYAGRTARWVPGVW